MIGPDLQASLNRLGYTSLWVEAGILDPASLPEQIAGLADDPNTEHYRYGTIRRFLLSRDALTDDQFDAVLKIITEDDDRVMAGSVLLSLLGHRGLTSEQRQRVVAHPRLRAEFPRQLRREKLLLEIDRGEPPPDVLRQALEHGDAVVHMRLLQLELPADLLNELTVKGANKSVRHHARAALHRLRRGT